MAITIGSRVNRIEDREIVGATVLAIDDQGGGMIYVEIAYDEGGTGWWPIECLEEIVEPPPEG